MEPNLDLYPDVPGTKRPSAFNSNNYQFQITTPGNTTNPRLPLDTQQTMVQARPTAVQQVPQSSMFDRNRLLNPNIPINNGALDGGYSDFLQQDNYGEGNNTYGKGTQSQLNALKKREGSYDTIGDIGDNAGLSVGAYQLTEKSGSVQQLAKDLGISNYDRLTPGQRKEVLSGVINTSHGRKVQDNLVMNKYFKPAQKAASAAGVTDGKIVEFLIDTNVNGGMRNVINRAKKKGGLNMANLKAARIDRYNQLVKDNPKRNSKFIKGWINRVNEF